LNLSDLAEAWIVLWGISYILTAVLTPNISKASPFLYGALGAFILFIVVLNHVAYDNLGYYIVAALFLAMALSMVYGAIVSWTGLGLWNVPFPSKEPFQISMAVFDMISALFMYLTAQKTFRKRK
jgi:hypothetical protein